MERLAVNAPEVYMNLYGQEIETPIGKAQVVAAVELNGEDIELILLLPDNTLLHLEASICVNQS